MPALGMTTTTTELAGEIRKVALDGRLDIEGTGEIELKFATLTAAHKKPVIVDMSQVSFIASIGMRLLVNNAKALNNSGHKMVILKPEGLVRDALETAGIDSLIPIFDDEAEALAAAGA